MKKKGLLIAIAGVLFLLICAGGVWLYFTMFEGEDKPYVQYFTPGDSFVTNLRDSPALLKATLVLEINQKVKEEELTEQTVMIRDVILHVLRSQTPEDVGDLAVQSNLSDQICKALNDSYQVEYFQKVYFSELVVQ